ncbi:hypothetical protein P153DRAFT_365596 [Dothidotthia symphoricarpi CBS 119687]|uniref:Uncharacterized protein n=1 Tax=Dothidotthia symphoricarpi CBS 119687 TaxID=1392245 RepID=A0A6A6AKK4_9PLEO|nr:uncharacterized protein P153DRAFT_365596 [Dothidotthia symphoricarpi CBS 119687]KAF2130971.1 hypothetical protein P153DRAFT_365596 [Dothidotthia symphoricarpi CBS 119687]
MIGEKNTNRRLNRGRNKSKTHLVPHPRNPNQHLLALENPRRFIAPLPLLERFFFLLAYCCCYYRSAVADAGTGAFTPTSTSTSAGAGTS